MLVGAYSLNMFANADCSIENLEMTDYLKEGDVGFKKLKVCEFALSFNPYLTLSRSS